MEAKKFEINNSKKFEIKKKFQITSILGNKKFEIKDFKSKKKFIILNEQHEQGKLWYQQENSSDCGPCLLLNTASILEIKIPHKNVQELRSYLNEIGQEDDRRIKGHNEWFSVHDINDYITKVMKLNVYPEILQDNYTNFEEFKNRLKIPYEMLYFTGGSHFVGVIPEEENYLFLDSFLNSPQIIDEKRLDEIIKYNISNSNNNRVNQAGIIRK